MNKILTTLALILIIGSAVSQAQTVNDSWAFGFGLTYPRYVNVNIQPLNSNIGGFLSLQRNFSENVGLRFKASYNHLEGQWNNASNVSITERTNLLTGALDLLYYFAPCARVSPYLFAGGGASLRALNNNTTTYLDENETALSFNVGGGVQWTLNSSWKIMAEYGYHNMFNSELDGAVVAGENNGTDSYMGLNLGLQYIFGKGNPSKMCEPCQGITAAANDMTDYNKIEDMIIKHIPKEVIKEVVVYKNIVSVSEDRLVLIGVNFAFDKADLLPESYPVLNEAVKLLSDKPDVNVEIEGYCDYIGTEEYNLKLSEERAQTVKSYLVSKGIAENRLTTVGFGKSNPIADNKTDEGRALNRRIVFRIIK
jgi:OOP family OmpA-OmpF porin